MRATIFLMALLAGMVGAIMPTAPTVPAAGQPRAGSVHVITVSQAITPATTSYITRAIEQATATRAEALIIRLDTPGGLLGATREIVQALLAAHVPVVVFISPAGARGASAGTMITMASHVAVMAPGTHIGAAHPVSLFGGGDNEIMAEKILNDTSAFIESITQLRGRNVEWAISSVRESKSITAQQALELRVVELIAEDLADLVRQLHGREVRMSKNETVTLNTLGRAVLMKDMSFSQSFMSLISNPNLVFLLLIIGVVGLYIEFSNPGLFYPGIVGAISLLMALVALQTLPVSYGALGLMLLGAALLVAESFVPSFGILGIGGLAAMVVGSVFLLDSAQTDLRISLPVIGSSVAAIGLVALVLGRLIVKSFSVPQRSFQSRLVGQIAEVREEILPDSSGLVFVNGELWKASAAARVEPGMRVRIEQADGLMLQVAQVDPDGGEQDSAT